MTKSIRIVLATALFLFASSRSAMAQSDVPRGIVTSASEKVALKPEKLRLIMWIKAQGNDPKSSVIALAEHKVRVAKELEALKANKETIVFSSTRVAGSDANGNEQRMMQMQMRAMRSNGNADEKLAEPPVVVTAMCAVKADWPLPVQEGDALAMLPATLMDQIKNRDFAGERNKPKLSEEEQEKLDEMEAVAQEDYGYYEQSSEEGPQITFLATISEDVTKAATGAAFKKAVQQATTLSAATGVALGKLSGVTSSTANVSNYEMYSRSYGNESSLPESFSDDETIISATVPDELSLNATVVVSYQID